ncbi:transcription-repair coupling factor [bacterium]|nr:transcription-repair coupling factor [bacterium]
MDLKNYIRQSPHFGQLKIAVDAKQNLVIRGNIGSFPAFIIAELFDLVNHNIVVITPYDEENLFEDLQAIAGIDPVYWFPPWDILPYEHKLPDNQLTGFRLRTLERLLFGPPALLVTSPRAIQQPTINPDLLKEISFQISPGDIISQDHLMKQLFRAGYSRENLVEFTQTCSRRGGIVDIFSFNYQDPVRIEFLGNRVESIRLFRTSDQRSYKELDSVRILPTKESLKNFDSQVDGKEISLEEQIFPRFRQEYSPFILENLVAKLRLDRNFPGHHWYLPFFKPEPSFLLQYLEKPCLYILLEPPKIHEVMESAIREAGELFHRAHERELPLPEPQQVLLTPEKLDQVLAQAHSIQIHSMIGEKSTNIDFDLKPHPVILGKMNILDNELKHLHEHHYRIFILCENVGQLKRLEENSFQIEKAQLDVERIGGGFIYPALKLAVFTDHQIFARYKIRFRHRWYHEGQEQSFYQDLKEGDYVVHTNYGIGKYLRLEKLTSKVGITECIVIEYANEEKLYVPVEDFHLVQKYLGKTGSIKLATLGSKKWENKRSRLKTRLRELTGELIHLYALRETLKGYSYSEDDELQQQLEDSFVYTETEDQLRSIQEVKRDLEKATPMDRLLCGDVGFGKTEVALRAAFKVVRESRQVALLVPTTILAQQHFNTFSERFRDFPVKVDMLSRFRSREQQKEILKKVQEGRVDILIGTHRLLSEDIQFKDLGLLVIDEEQRFGVAHKEKIKRWRSQIDVLTMTATPIPRTLYFSLSGARDISFINTPPEQRLSVYTQVVEFDPEIFIDAIHRELDRGGQVFFLHNRVQTIQAIARYLQDLLPEVRFVVAHGQMKDHQLENVFMDFLNRKYDVLVTTNIIESGTDIPNVNTIFINRADQFGLADLYQLRGRVGRSDQQAFAYLVIPPYRKITHQARKRLNALLEHSDLGSGFQLALRDLEIRGSGNLLGKEQHGFIEEVGMTLYTQLLKEAIAELKGQKPPVFIPIPVQVDFPMFVPKDYIPSPDQRIGFYQKAYMANNEKKLQRVRAEIKDRFGNPPQEVLAIYQYLMIRLLASQLPIAKVIFRKNRATVFFNKNFIFPLMKFQQALKGAVFPLRFTAGETHQLVFDFSDEQDSLTRLKIVYHILTYAKKAIPVSTIPFEPDQETI